MKRNCHTSIRILSLILPVSLVAADMVSGWRAPVCECIFTGMFAGSVILTATPRSKDDYGFSFRTAAVGSAAIILGRLLTGRTDSALILSLALELFLLSAFTFRKYRRISSLFKTDSSWRDISDYSWLFYEVIMLSLLSLYGGFLKHTVGEPVAMALSLILYAVLYRKAYSGRTLMLPHKKENEIKEIIKGNLRPYLEDDPNEGVRMNALYKKVVEYMDTCKPFLRDGFEISDLAEEMLTNRSYLSRAINLYSGRNFCQFVNYHRIKYAVSIMEKDLGYKIQDLSAMSGFHTVVSFNMAFKLFMKETPSEYINRLKVKRL